MNNKSTAPKDALVNLIINNFNPEDILTGLNLSPGGNLNHQIYNRNKSTLIEFLNSTELGKQLLKNIEDKYPLSGAPTFYIVIARNLPTKEEIIARSYGPAHETNRTLGPTVGKTVKQVYNTEEARVLNFGPDIIEIPVYYERRIEYTSTEPETWGESKAIYDLRRAFIWVSRAYYHGLIACSDYAALLPIRNWVYSKLFFKLELPNIPLDMFQKLAKGGTPRAATFSATEFSSQASLDIQSLSVYDQELESRDTFQKLQEDQNNWEQTAGYFSRHPSIPIGGLGIARRYGRIWTPNHLPKDQLISSALDLITRTEAELSEKLETNDITYLDHFRAVNIKINGRNISGEVRNIFEKIAWSLIHFHKHHVSQDNISDDLVIKIIECNEFLGFILNIEAECNNCGTVLVRCPICSSPYDIFVREGQIKIGCSLHTENGLDEDAEIKCDCGQEIEIKIPNNIKMYPGHSTITALRSFISTTDLKFDDWFMIDGNLLRIYKQRHIQGKQYHLSELNIWRLRAHIHTPLQIPEPRLRKIKNILRDVKEKCNKNKWHPTAEQCHTCLKGNVSIKNISQENMCLPRLLGIAIGEKFDGQHGGYEQADIKYKDKLVGENDQDVRIGIHLKSREKKPPIRGVGQDSKGIKGLYAQYFYTLHKGLTGNKLFDITGISIPNKIFVETRDAFVDIAKELNEPIIILDEEIWISIVSAALENIELINELSGK